MKALAFIIIGFILASVAGLTYGVRNSHDDRRRLTDPYPAEDEYSEHQGI